ncbi:MAG TPA: LPS assembly protein LptD [Candidatus Omnitrophota bacterium]|nr:LPS assembly protein LptD [Candidatus Omnitrophota bacterium]
MNRRSNLILFFLASAALMSCPPRALASAIDAVKDKVAEKSGLAAAGEIDSPVTVNGDTVEYSTEEKRVVATGNVLIIYKGTTLSCDRVSVDTVTKDAIAEGNVHIKDDKEGVMTGSRVLYNFSTRTGTVIDGDFMSDPYYGRAREISRVSESEFRANNGYATTCGMDTPHYRVTSKRITIYPGDKIKSENDVVYIGKCPVAWLPFYNHSLKEPLMHVQLSPGHSKDWGYYLLSAWRYYFSDDLSGRIYADYRNELGFAEGFGANYRTGGLGMGDLKYYYIQERPRSYEEDQPAEFERSLIRWRHKWIIDDNTDYVSEYYKINDAKRAAYGAEHNMLKDFFYREYEKDSQPRSYAQVHRNFDYSSMDVLVQARVNDWYNAGFIEKLPEVTYSLPSFQLGDSRFYFDDSSTIANLNKKNTTSTSRDPNVHVNRLDSTNKVLLPMKVAFLQLTPFTGTRETVYNADLDADARIRTIYLTGTDVSTKFFRVFDVRTNAYGLDVNQLRHVITPTVGYAYDHEPTIPASKLRQIDSTDSISYSSNRFTLGLTNALQTKRQKKTVDLALFTVSSSYYIRPKTGPGSYMSDYSFDLELKPYSWLSFMSDAVYSHRYDYFSNANYDIILNIASERTFNLGQRYQRKGTNEITFGYDWRLTPKWKLGLYERYQVNDAPRVPSGWRYQEYRVSRDLHCWTMDLSYTVEPDHGTGIWLVFSLKAFPETSFKFDKTYHAPKPGSQSPY